jgi:hypothetical protein
MDQSNVQLLEAVLLSNGPAIGNKGICVHITLTAKERMQLNY